MSVLVYTAVISLTLPQGDMWLVAGVPVHRGEENAETFWDCWR